MKLVYLDTETSGLGQNDRLLQLCFKVDGKVSTSLFNPGVKIDTVAMSVHHITDEMVKEKETFKDSKTFAKLRKLLSSDESIVIAHNARFDIKMLEKEGLEISRYICTLKLAKYLLSEKEEVANYKLQYLRYYFGIESDDAKAHDAEGDVIVLEKVFEKLRDIAISKAKEKNKDVSEEAVFERMIEISTSQVMLKQRMPFGKHIGKFLSEVVRIDRPYCEWLVKTSSDDDDLISSIRYLLKTNIS